MGRQDAECRENRAFALHRNMDETGWALAAGSPAREYRAGASVEFFRSIRFGTYTACRKFPSQAAVTRTERRRIADAASATAA